MICRSLCSVASFKVRGPPKSPPATSGKVLEEFKNADPPSFALVIHFLFVPETRGSVLLDREAKRRRKAGEVNVYGPGEVKEKRFNWREILIIWGRPFEMFIREVRFLFPSMRWPLTPF